MLPYLTAEAVHAALDYPSLIEALRAAHAAPGTAPLRHVHLVNEREHGRLLLMPAWREGGDIGVKIVSVFPGNRARGAATVSALYLLLEGATGHPVALIDGEALTLRRTAAASALASTFLSRADSETLLVVGPGRLAPYMAAAHCRVRPIRRVLVWGRSIERSRAGAAAIAAMAQAPAEAVSDLREALARCDIVCCATTAREPVLRGAWLRPGTHVDLVGAFAADMRESDDELILRSELFVDTRAGALREAGDLVQPIQAGTLSADHIRADLHDLCSARHHGRSDREAITVFKSVGAAIQDLAAAGLAMQRLGRTASPEAPPS
ncbi:MAG: ornithine cyclodeaminase family protein [Betaproteobacteria bacterium]|nr:ornithine cyclodeaminase family protein [Betaproteobacteria bacterium]